MAYLGFEGESAGRSVHTGNIHEIVRYYNYMLHHHTALYLAKLITHGHQNVFQSHQVTGNLVWSVQVEEAQKG